MAQFYPLVARLSIPYHQGMLLALLLLLSTQAPAIELRSLAVHYQWFDSSNRIPDLDGFKAKEGLALSMETDLFWRFYWNSSIMSLTDAGQYRLVGLNMHLGARVTDSLSVEYEHFSKHLLDHGDGGYPAGKFPVQDSVGVVWTLYHK